MEKSELVEYLEELLEDTESKKDIEDKYDFLYGAIEDLMIKIKYE